MKNKCSQCGLGFIESPTLYQKRLRTKGPRICRECNRINLAEARAEKRKEFDKKTEKTQCETQLEILKRAHKMLSIPLLMNKLKISHLEAKELLEKN